MDIQKRVQGQLDIPNLNVLYNGTRVGHDERKRTVHHIKEMEAKGYLPEEEASARITHAANAENTSDLRMLTADLPALIDHRSYWKKFNWDDPKYFIPALLLGMFTSVCTALIPGLILGQLHHFSSALGLGIFIPTLALGVIGFFTSLVLLVIKSSE